MKNKYKPIVRNISYALIANIISLFISILMNLIVPRSVGVQEFAYWQLYIFYSGYVIYLNFGWCDGIYLKYAGKSMDYLKQENINHQIYFLTIYELMISLIVGFYAYFAFNDNLEFIVFAFSLLSGVIFVLRITFQYIMQATSQIKRYSLTVIVDRVFFLLIVVIILILGKDRFYHLVFADILAKVASLVLAIYLCRDIFNFKKINLKSAFIETVDLVKGGIKLISASFISMLIIGLIRLSIVNKWGVVVFGQVSLTLSLSNMLTLFIGSISMVLFPILRNMDVDTLKRGYSLLRTSLAVPVLGILTLYKPFYYFLSNWLPEYSTSLKYMAILLPITFFETKNNLILNNYLKTIRKESWILITNLITIILCFLLIYISVYRLNNLDYSVYSILLLIAFRSILTELILGKIIKIKLKKNMIAELLVIACFLVSNVYIDSNISAFVYLGAYLLYIIFIKNEIKELKKFAKDFT